MRSDRTENGEVMHQCAEGPRRHSRSFGEIPRFHCERTTPVNVTSKFQVLGMTKGLIYPHSRGVIREDADPVNVSFGFIPGGIVFAKRKQNIFVNTKGGSVSCRFGACCCYMQRKANWRRRAYSAWSWLLWAASEALNGARTSRRAYLQIEVYSFERYFLPR